MGLFVFRRYKRKEGGKTKKAKHPKLIIDKNGGNLTYMGLTESVKTGHHKNIELVKNPKEKDTRKAYIRKEIRTDIEENFGDILKNYKLSEEDKKTIIEFLEKKRKK